MSQQKVQYRYILSIYLVLIRIYYYLYYIRFFLNYIKVFIFGNFFYYIKFLMFLNNLLPTLVTILEGQKSRNAINYIV